MKYKNAPITQSTRELTIEREDGAALVLKVSSVSIGVRRDYLTIYPRPTVPLSVTETKTGRKTEENWHDPKFRKDIDEHEYLQNIYIVYRVLMHDPNVSFENSPTSVEALRLLAAEFSASGLSEGDLVVILKEALKASNVAQEEIETAKAVF